MKTSMGQILLLVLVSCCAAKTSLLVDDVLVDSITLSPGESCAIAVTSDDSISYNAYIGFAAASLLGEFFHVETRMEAGDLGNVFQYSADNLAGYYLRVSGLTSPPSAGTQFVFVYQANTVGETDLNLYSDGFAALMATVHISVVPAGMGTAFSYQGKLYDEEVPSQGTYDLKFTVFDAADPNSSFSLGEPVTIEDYQIVDGQLNLKLDFGKRVFDGSARWLEVAVKPGDSPESGEYTILRPRRKIMPTPYALYAARAGSVETNVQVSQTSDDPIIRGANTGEGVGVFGIHEASQAFGYLGSADHGVFGSSGASENVGVLGGIAYGVYGANGVSRNVGALGGADYAVYGAHETSSNVGVLGASDYAVYGSSESGYAGYFDGDVTVDGSLATKGLKIPTGAVEGYVLTAGADGTATWQAPSGPNRTDVFRTFNSITAPGTYVLIPDKSSVPEVFGRLRFITGIWVEATSGVTDLVSTFKLKEDYTNNPAYEDILLMTDEGFWSSSGGAPLFTDHLVGQTVPAIGEGREREFCASVSWTGTGTVGITVTGYYVPVTAFEPVSDPPSQPDIEYKYSDYAGSIVYCRCESADPEGFTLYFMWDWGDGTTSGWTGPFSTGSAGGTIQGNATHIWLQKGYYERKVKAKDIWGKESSWSRASTIYIR